MRSFRLVLLALLVSPIPLPASAPPAHPFQDPKLPARERAADLVARMSDEEKVRQMDMWQGDDFTTAGALDAEKTKAVLAGQGLGAVHYLFPSPALANAFQRLVMTDSRWGIPALVSEEMLHGYTARGSTSFPMPLALAGSFDAELVRAIGRAIATEARSQGVQLDFGPVLDVCSDPRYGRIDETFGEAPYLTATLGLAMIRGLQGEGWSDPLAVAAMPKHFIGHGKPSGGYHIAPVQMGERELRTEYLPPFAAAVRGQRHGITGRPARGVTMQHFFAHQRGDSPAAVRHHESLERVRQRRRGEKVVHCSQSLAGQNRLGLFRVKRAGGGEVIALPHIHLAYFFLVGHPGHQVGRPFPGGKLGVLERIGRRGGGRQRDRADEQREQHEA